MGGRRGCPEPLQFGFSRAIVCRVTGEQWGEGVKLGEILPWVWMGGGWGEGAGGVPHNDQDSAILVSVIFSGASNY